MKIWKGQICINLNVWDQRTKFEPSFDESRCRVILIFEKATRMSDLNRFQTNLSNLVTEAIFLTASKGFWLQPTPACAIRSITLTGVLLSVLCTRYSCRVYTSASKYIHEPCKLLSWFFVVLFFSFTQNHFLHSNWP